MSYMRRAPNQKSAQAAEILMGSRAKAQAGEQIATAEYAEYAEQGRGNDRIMAGQNHSSRESLPLSRITYHVSRFTFHVIKTDK